MTGEELEKGRLEAQGFVEPPQEELGRAEEELKPPPDPQSEVEKEPDKQLNYSIPIAVAQISWPHDPATAEKYVQTTGPLLDLIEFHECLGGMGELPPMVRLALGLGVIAGGVVVMKVTQRKKEPREKREATPREAAPDERRATGKDQLPGRPEGKASGDGPLREEPTANGPNRAGDRVGPGGENDGAVRPFHRPYARRGE